MHSEKAASEIIQALWANYQTLGRDVDLEMMPLETIDALVQQKAMIRPFRIAAWLARLGYFIAAWALWEAYARGFCGRLPIKLPRSSNDSIVDWLAKSLAANQISFAAKEWFSSANCLRNLIAHFGARIEDPRATRLLERSRVAFTGLSAFPDGYVEIRGTDAAELQVKIEEFIDDMSIAREETTSKSDEK